MAATVYAVCNQKGGCAKTVTSVSFGIGLAREGKKVLLCHSSNYLEPFSSVYLDVLSGSDSVLVRLNGGYSA